LQSLEGGEDGERIRLLTQESLLTGITLDELVVRSGLSQKRTEAALTGLLTKGLVVQMVRDPRTFLAKESFETLKSMLLAGLDGYLRDNPLKEGIGKEELKARIPRRSDLRFFGPLLMSLEKEEKAIVDRDLVKKPGWKAGGEPSGEELLEKIETALRDGGMEPPNLKELGQRLDRSEKELLDHINLLVRSGRAVKVKSDILYAPGPLEEIRSRLVRYLEEKGEITPPEFREITGLSRKFMMPLLEYFDQEKVTIRVGDKRVARKK
ncbi:MAG TPA: SelB C-terminal domain-containing protein, partial [Geobacteraceae bacterium]|nr:SelB C-terminal domain-containing protein [Geobacteraceae bacterium]